MINYDKWINSLPKTHSKIDEKNNQLDHDRWVGTIPKMGTIPKKSLHLSMNASFLQYWHSSTTCSKYPR